MNQLQYKQTFNYNTLTMMVHCTS